MRIENSYVFLRFRGSLCRFRMCSRHCVCALGYEVLVVFCIVQCCLVNFGFCAPDRTKREIIEDSVQSYLMKFGYLSPTADGAGALRTEESVREAIKQMQQFAGLPVTGSLDQSTVKLLHRPRCGLPDVLSSGDRRRSKRYVVHAGKAWPYTNLTWSLRSTNIPNVDSYEARVVFARALDIWSQHSKLTFTEVNSDKADILIYFHRGEHGDNFAFDGKGSVLAHAFFPGPGRGGDAHFDMDEIWLTEDTNNMNEEGTNLFKVAAHEFGHSLGLSHSNVSGALMAPWYQAFQSTDYVLPEDDRQGIQFLYGSREDRMWAKIPHYATAPTTHRTTRPTDPPDRRHHNNPDYPYYPHNPRTHTPHRPYPEAPRTEKPPYPPRKPIHPDKKYPPKYPDKPHHYPNHYPKDDKHPQKHYPVKPRDEYPKYPDRTPDRTPFKYPGRTPDRYPERTPDRYPERTPDRYPERTPDRYPERTPDRYPERTPEKVPDLYPRTPDRYPTPNLPRIPETEKTTVRVPIRHHPSLTPTKKPPPDTCDTSFDAVAVIRREVFFFKDAYFWRIGDSGLLKGYPAQISRMWSGLPGNFTNVDAVYERPDNKIVFFIGRLFYVYTGNQLERGYPKPLTFLGLPASLEHIDGATVWGHNGKTFFFSGNVYWRFDEDTMKVELDYPRPINMWKGVGTDIDAVFQWKDGKTYFFKEKGFWKFNDLRMRVEEEEQIPSGPFWMGCSRNFQSHHHPSKQPYIDDSGSNTNTIRSNFTVIIALGVILKLYALIT